MAKADVPLFKGSTQKHQNKWKLKLFGLSGVIKRKVQCFVYRKDVKLFRWQDDTMGKKVGVYGG